MNAFKHTLSVVTLGLLALSASAPALALENGPVPTLAALKADGPYAVTAQTVTGSGFGGGTVYVPNTTGQYALVAVCPGFVSAQSSMTAIGKRLATHGFVVVTISTNTLLDFPSSRATQLLAALKTVSTLKTGAVVGKIDVSRQVVAGWSMGGGGTLEAAGATPALKAAVAFAPWDTSTTKMKVNTVPALILGGTADTVAPVSAHSQKFYDAIPASTKKALAVITGADHFFPTTASEPTGYSTISWTKRFADGDTRYSAFLNGQDAALSSFASNGPF
jgi:dienelactone hydrolase